MALQAAQRHLDRACFALDSYFMAEFNPDMRPLASHRSQASLRGPLVSFALAAFAGTALVSAAAVVLVGVNGPAVVVALCGYVAGAILAFGLMRRGYPHEGLGVCNFVTLIRLALCAALLAPLAGTADAWAVFAVAAVALALDGMDGWLARREQRVSDFGARFDMEVDSALALVLALNAWVSGSAGVIVLLIGLPRYVFAAASLGLPWLARPVPELFSRKVVCVLQLVTLIALQLPPVAASVANPVVVVVAATLVWSFGRDVLWLWRSRQ
ncbi:MAG: phosphatidylglycerophosphate synthase [Dinoroseobacter sp.]|jgi:phosphatidylglycerophosphate synthase